MAWQHHDYGSRARTLFLEIRYGLAYLRLRAAILKFDQNQPRDDHGRWTRPRGGGGGLFAIGDPGGETFVTDETGEETWASVASSYDDEGAISEQVISNRDGSEIRSEFNPPDHASWDERHTVKTLDGTRVRFLKDLCARQIIEFCSLYSLDDLSA